MAFLQLEGNLLVSKHLMYIRYKGLTISISHILIMLIDESSQLWDLVIIKIDKIFLLVISTSYSEELHLDTKFGKALSLFIREHCSTKWSLKILAFI